MVNQATMGTSVAACAGSRYRDGRSHAHRASFDEYLERKFPESRRKAYHVMAIYEHLPRIPKADLNLMGWTKARELVKVARREGQNFDCAPWVHKARELPREEFKREVENT